MKRPIHPMPDDVKEALEGEGLMAAYRERPKYQQNDYIGWIGRARLPATRQKRLQQMLDEGAAAPYILFMITRQVRLLVEVKDLINQKCNRNEIRDRMGIASDFVLNKALEQSRNYSMERLEQIYRKILETDISIKQGIWKGDLALDLLVAELCV